MLGWRPLLEGRLADAAWDAIDAIAHALVDPREPLTLLRRRLSPSDPDQRLCRAWLSLGRTGSAVFHAHVARSGRGSASAETAWDHLDQGLEAVEGSSLETVGLWGGYTGLAWALRHLHRVLEVPFEEKTTEDIDGLLEVLLQEPWTRPIDFTTGLLGVGTYALEWLPNRRARALVARVVDQLGALAEHDENGVSWRVPPRLVSSFHRDLAETGYRDLGLAHGVPGVIAFLSLACGSGAAPDRARELLAGAVPWLLSQRQDPPSPQRFRYWVEKEVEEKANRAGWCYGDPGIAAALVLAGTATETPVWTDAGLDLAHEVGGRDVEAMHLTDPGMCHGAAGTAHVFNRIWQWTGNDACRRTAELWMERLLAMRRPGEGCAGFKSLMRDAEGQPVEVADEGLSMGSAGIGLALLAAVGKQEPEWDRVFLLSGPPSSVH